MQKKVKCLFVCFGLDLLFLLVFFGFVFNTIFKENIYFK